MSAVPQSRPFTDYKSPTLRWPTGAARKSRIAETEMPGLMAIREEYAATAAAERRAHHRLAAHDDPDRGADRDAAGARRRSALGLLQHLLDPGPRRRRDRRRAARRCSPTRARSLEEYWEYTHRIFEWPDGGYANMILDDGGDATLLLHLGTRAEKDRVGAAKPGQRRGARPLRRDQEAPRRPSPAGTPRAARRQSRA